MREHTLLGYLCATLAAMGDYGRSLEFGVSLVPNAEDVALARDLARRADALGFELLGIQDHPYQRRFVETWMLIADLLARTERLRVFPDVANLPLRFPAMIAKQAATLDVLSGGRFELGLGGGTFWDAIEAMGGPRRTPPETLEALTEAIEIIRRYWSGERAIRFEGTHYSVAGVQPGPAPAHEIGIWLGVMKPRGLRLTGRVADGWVVSVPYAPPSAVPSMSRHIDEAAAAAGREPAAIRRVYNVMGEVTDGATGELLHGPVEHWVEQLTTWALELGFDTFVFWPARDPVAQLERFAAEVAAAVRAEVRRAHSA
jgi:alkanesulfonate monooxygenase SsuD/methylene tetrahydromethanopterin reductase-like flavin-dependent oxidoreductase (luciferase family)